MMFTGFDRTIINKPINKPVNTDFMQSVNASSILEGFAQSSTQPPIFDWDGIDEVTESVVFRYFQTLNAGDFEATSQLFATDGVLQPPFDTPLVGPKAIAAYLQAEARDLILQPHSGTSTLLENGCTEVQIGGRVQTPLFTVNVSWQFILSPEKSIFLAKIKLIASLQELFNLRQQDGKLSAYDALIQSPE